MSGSLQLHDYPTDLVQLSCTKCVRRASIDKLKRADIRLPDLREDIAQCGRKGQMHEACMVRYIDLIRR
jgi:hypothetical protein